MRSLVALLSLVALAALATRRAGALPPMPIVAHEGGFLVGSRLMSAGLSGPPREYAAFWGVPYAQPPVGALRFKPPVPMALPSGMASFNSDNVPVCLQQGRGNPYLEGSEDCLKVHVFTPNYDSPSLPVLVVLHGGGYMYGRAPKMGLQYLMDYPIVVVTVEYRLGMFEDAEQPGNMGLQDMVESLRWVQKNIGLFGGSNSSVTLAGFSAGSASSLLLTMSPQSKGLFHRVIAMSGSPLNPWAMQQGARDRALHVASAANCSAASTTAMVDCLRGKDAEWLVALQGTHLQDWLHNPFSPFAPVVDRWARAPLLPEEPRRALARASDVPMVLSVTEAEGLFTAAEFVMDPEKVARLDRQWEADAPALLHFHGSPDARKAEMARKIRQHYLQNATLAVGWRQLVKLMGDWSFVVGIAEHARMQAATHKSPVHMYRFAYRGQHSLSQHESGGNPADMGVSHADDYQYLFEFPWSGFMSRPEDVQMRRQLVGLWASFANGSAAGLGGAAWSPVPREGEALEYLLISSPTNMTVVRERDIAQTSFWKSLNSSASSPSLCLGLLVAVILALAS